MIRQGMLRPRGGQRDLEDKVDLKSRMPILGHMQVS